MVEINDRRLPVGIQSFEVIREGGYLYVDKTDIIWQLANRDKKYNYLSRPRRFGKSVLVDTLEAYFLGKKELFEGLKIMQMETEWVKRPVIRLDMSRAGAAPESVRSYLDNAFHQLESEYDIAVRQDSSLADRFDAIIQTAYNKTGLQVAILIDEYDSPLQHSWKTPQHEACTAVYREVFAILKADDKYEKFVFITGITKFTQISLFSVLNNLSNISFEPNYAAICGITKEEVLRDFKPEINKLAAKNDWNLDEAVAQLAAYYDGYHFCEDSEDIYNPYSLMRCFYHRRLQSYWYASGTPTFLLNEIKKRDADILKYDGAKARETEFDLPTESMNSLLPLMYQAGYLTIKDYNPSSGIYVLGIPNAEVKAGLMENVLPMLNGTNSADNASYATQIIDSLSDGNIDKMMEWLQAFLSSIPYMQQGKDVLADVAKLEALYQRDLYVFFSGMSAQVQVETMMADGRVDMVMHISDYIFIFEFKVRSSAKSALEQINKKHYFEPWRPVQRKIVKCGVLFDVHDRTLKDWKYEVVG